MCIWDSICIHTSSYTYQNILYRPECSLRVYLNINTYNVYNIPENVKMLDAFTHTHLYASVQHASQPAFDIAFIAWGDSSGDGQPTVNNNEPSSSPSSLLLSSYPHPVLIQHTTRIPKQTYHSFCVHFFFSSLRFSISRITPQRPSRAPL